MSAPPEETAAEGRRWLRFATEDLSLAEREALRQRLPDGWEVRRRPPDLARLSALVIESRYPGEWPEPTPDDAREAVGLAAEVLEAVRRDLARAALLPRESA